MGFIDFDEVKEAVSFAAAIDYLDLGNLKRAGNQWRGPCPACQSGGDRALVLTEGRGFFCFSDKKGGDVIALASHILGCSVKEAAQELAQRAGIVQVPSTGINTVSTSSRERGGQRDQAGPQDGMQPLSYLEHEHDAVIALGFDPAVAQKLGIGYAPKGVVRGSVAVPVRDETGALLGYLGVQELTYLPPDFTTNVVPLKRRA